MENQPNKIVNALYKQYIALNQANLYEKNPDAYYTQCEDLKKGLLKITIATGAISVMSKPVILKLCALESSLRFMQLHTFLNCLSKANEEINP